MLCVAKNNSEYVEVTPVEVVQPNLQEKSITITENGTTEVVADSGYDGLAKVSIEANVKDNSLLNVIKGINSYNKDTPEYHFELTADMWDENSTEIRPYQLQYNKNIVKVTIPQNIKKIGGYSFDQCTNLRELIIQGNNTQIMVYSFEWCSALERIVLKGSIKSFDNYIIYGQYPYLSIIDCRETTTIPTIQSNTFYSLPTTCKFIIPDELYDSWIASTNWVSLYNKGYQFVKASEYTEA